jgi:hypothetical protein
MFLILLKASPILANFGQTKHIFCFVFILHTYRTVYVGIQVSNKIKEFCVFQELAGFFKNSTDQLVTDPNHKAVYFTAMNILGTFYFLIFLHG